MSDDGAYGLTLIAFVGSVFSPYYAWARRRGSTNPENHCAFNVALYAAGASRWAMTERAAAKVHREASQLSIGPSAMRWNGDALEIRIDEVGAPVPRRVRGTIRLIPEAMFDRGYALDDAGLHRWTPFAPRARVEVAFTEPSLRWSGPGYLDSNGGAEPLENSFAHWTWSRTAARDGTVVLYDVTLRDAVASRAGGAGARPDAALPPTRSLALRFDAGHRVHEIEPPPLVALPPTGWRVSRQTRTDDGCPARVVKTLEDAPFYSRAVIEATLHGVHAAAIHESLDLDRFNTRWVQCLLPFRMPRVPF